MNTSPEALKLPCPAETPIYRSLLPELRAGRLSQSEQEALRRHLLLCEPCRDQAARAADDVIERAVLRHYGNPATGEAPFLTFDAIQRHAATSTATHANGADGVDTARRLPMYQDDGDEIMTLDDKAADAATLPDEPTSPPVRPPNRWRTVAAVVATVTLIALFALLLRGFAAGKGASSNIAASSAPTTSAISSATPASGQQTPSPHGKWHTLDSFTYTSMLFTQTPYPVFSPKDPAIVYETTLSPITTRRSDDGGATWKTLQLPSGADKAIEIELFASPLDAHTAFLTVTVNLAYGQGLQACPSSARASVGGATHGTILASGQIPCSTTYRSTNEGNTWKAISFPVNGTISTPYSDTAPYHGTPIQAQDTRLYALLSCGPTCNSAGGRLVSSSDGGATWQVADAGGLGQGVCDFAVPPTGQTVFAAVSRGSCDAVNSPALAIDRSDDAGANWVHASFLPGGTVQGATALGAAEGMAAVIVNGKTLLIVNAPLVVWQPHIIGVTSSASQFLVSRDSGRTWTRSPLKGVPDAAEPVASRLIVQADGSLVVAFASPHSGGLGAILYSWQAGAASWREFAPAPSGYLSTLLRTSSPSGDTFWAVTQSRANQAAGSAVFTFTVASYQP